MQSSRYKTIPNILSLTLFVSSLDQNISGSRITGENRRGQWLEFISNALDAWAYVRGIKLQFIRLGKPVDNCCMESVAGKFRDDYLNENWFMCLEQVRKIVEAWWIDYNYTRTHSSLGNLTLAEFKLQEMSKIGQNL